MLSGDKEVSTARYADPNVDTENLRATGACDEEGFAPPPSSFYLQFGHGTGPGVPEKGVFPTSNWREVWASKYM